MDLFFVRGVGWDLFCFLARLRRVLALPPAFALLWFWGKSHRCLAVSSGPLLPGPTAESEKGQED